MKELLTTEELCNALKITRQGVFKWRKEGLPYIKMGKLVRFDKEEVEKWLEDNKSK